MEVTQQNFQQLLPGIEAAIKEATFICIDGEFSGLNAGLDLCAFDTPAQYYAKIRTGAMDFLLLQFGLAMFRYDQQTKRYHQKVYNFYLFPKPMNRAAPDLRFLCQSSSMDFLSSVGFDFNKVFRDGIPYLSKPSEEKMRENLEERRRQRFSNKNEPIPEGVSTTMSVPIPEEYREVVEKACGRISELLSPQSMRREVHFERCNGFVRKLIYQAASQRFSPNELDLFTKNTVLVAKRGDGPDWRLREEKLRREREDKELEGAIGFALVAKALSESQKPLVGHNMLLDLCHMVNQFCMPLPEHYQSFKEMVNCLFPKILDTKYMSSIPPIKDRVQSNVLQNLLQAVSEPPFTLPEVDCVEGEGYQSVQDKHHEAGYDAYITGLAFIAMSNYLGTINTPPIELPILPDSPVVSPFLNKLFLMKVNDNFINLSGPEAEPNRSHVFHLSCPKTWKNPDVWKLFSPFGNVYVSWLKEGSCWASLFNKNQAPVLERQLSNFKTPGIKITSYAEYRALEANSSTPAPMSMTFSSPRPHKRAPQELSIDAPATGAKRKRRSLSSESRYSKRSIDSIPEEVEDHAAGGDTQDVPAAMSCLSELEKETDAKLVTGVFTKNVVWQ